MADANQGVEQKTESAPIQQSGVESTSVAPAEDPEVRIAKLLEENANLTRDRDNYRTGLLAMKGKTEIENLDLTDPTQLQTFIQKSVEDRLIQEKGKQNATELETYAKDLARKNKELSLALQARASASNGGAAAGGGGSSAMSTPEVGYYSPEQKAALEKRWAQMGIKADKFPEMLKQAEANSRALSA